jgi:NAD(P)-dependent dehydrogenase (short-subunit alcohol dehydrogenase family)
MSKAALNMASKSLAVDLREDQIRSVVLNPGWVKSDMGGERAPMPVETSATNLLRVIDGSGWCRVAASSTGAVGPRSRRVPVISIS